MTDHSGLSGVGYKSLASVARAVRAAKTAIIWAALGAAVALSASAFAADDDWQSQVGNALGKTGAAMPGGVYRVGLPRHRSESHARWRRARTQLCARRVARVRKDGRTGYGDGRPRADGGRGQSGHGKTCRRRYRDHGVAQSPSAQPPVHDVHACARTR